MADTIITPGSANESSSSATWAVAIVAIVVILVGAFIWFQMNTPAPPTDDQGIKVDVKLPGGNPPAPSPSPQSY